jgi:hypothetical protein
MSPDQIVIEAVVVSWKSTLDRANKFFSTLTDQQAQQQVAPGRNRILYLLGHLTAVHDLMLPLLRVGDRLHPELDEPFLKHPDRTTADADLPSLETLQQQWQEVNGRLLSLIEGKSAAWWTERHSSVSEEDFAKQPHRNRLSVFLSRTNHLSFHLGQLVLVPKPAPKPETGPAS